MYALVGAADKTDGCKPGRFGRIAGSGDFAIRETVVLGVRMLDAVVFAPPGSKPEKLRNLLRRFAGGMKCRRVHEICFAKDFPYKEELLREGFAEMKSELLKAALAGRIATMLGGAPNSVAEIPGDGKCALLLAGRMTAAVFGTLWELCSAFKYLMVMTETGEEGGLEELCRRTGVSVIRQPSARQLMNADVAVAYGPLSRTVVLPAKCVAYGVGDGALGGVVYERCVSGLSWALAGGLDDMLPGRFPRDTLLSAALCAGTVRAEDILIKDIFLARRALYGPRGTPAGV